MAEKILQEIQQAFETKLRVAESVEFLEGLRIEFLGKSGLLTVQTKRISELPVEQRKTFGAAVNLVKGSMETLLEQTKERLEDKELQEQLISEKIDITLPGRDLEIGKLNPITKVIEDIKEIFAHMGFSFEIGPDIEDDWHNFTALNIPDSHPARQMHDTFYLESGNLLRTHTSNVQIRKMMGQKPPFRFIAVGKVYRSDYDATHTPMFHQIEGVYVDKAVNMGHLKGCLENFLRLFFKVDKAPIRLRPSHFPFTEPSAEVDVQCDRSNKSEIKIGTGNDWLEILGAGMVHPNVLKNCGIDPEEYQG
ncbi:MAG: phenylalanine--tRNA ligase subunit alpha, partial [Candidatus Caenarcaniphilales bacterium]|nr:phenylalanine--tRNA ligase subunit alpha [Candidatus Caenarcaniphilales bacterium]